MGIGYADGVCGVCRYLEATSALDDHERRREGAIAVVDCGDAAIEVVVFELVRVLARLSYREVTVTVALVTGG